MTPAKRVRFAWIAFLLVTAMVYAPVWVKLVSDWWTDAEYSHGLICAPLAVAIRIGRRSTLALTPRAPLGAGLAGALAAVGLLLPGTLGAELFLTRWSLWRQPSSISVDGAICAP